MTHSFEFLSFGCHNLVGGSSLRKSIRLVQCAIDHGIIRFDVAPSYGMGTAETVLGLATKRRSVGIEITTKFGIEPPRLGRLLSWAREPYRYLRRRVGTRLLQTSIRLPGAEPPRVSLLKSLERSLEALQIDRVDTLLTHEFVDKKHLQEHLDDLQNARNRGLLSWFGCSGERAAVERSLSMFSDNAEVIQVSVSDGNAFESHPTVRLFGAVHVLAPRIGHQASVDERYRDELISVLPGVKSFQGCLALGAMACARTLFPRSRLLMTTSNEARMGEIVRFFDDRTLLAWASAHRVVHNLMIERARI